MLTYKALGWLLTYPDPRLIEAAPEALRAIAAERLLRLSRMDGVARFVDRLTTSDLIDLQEDYTATFDRGRATALHLFEHVHGEARDRGQAMVDLASLYRQRGLEMPGDELPDFLPLFLEYLSTLPEKEARQGLADCGPILANLHNALSRRDSPHAAIMAALLDLAGLKPNETAISQAANIPAEDIDREWEEAPVAFGPEAEPSPCSKAQAMVGRMNRNMDQNEVAS